MRNPVVKTDPQVFSDSGQNCLGRQKLEVNAEGRDEGAWKPGLLISSQPAA